MTEYLLRAFLEDLRVARDVTKNITEEQERDLNSKIEVMYWILNAKHGPEFEM